MPNDATAAIACFQDSPTFELLISFTDFAIRELCFKSSLMIHGDVSAYMDFRRRRFVHDSALSILGETIVGIKQFEEE